MSLHRLTEITLGVPHLEQTAGYYTEFGLIPLAASRGQAGYRFGTVDGGQQLRLVPSPVRKLLSLGIAAEDHDDLNRIAASLSRLAVGSRIDGDRLKTSEPVTGLEVVVSIAPRLHQKATPAPPYNAPGRIARPDARAPAILRADRVHPRRLGHVVIGSVDKPVTQRFFVEGLGFRLSDEIGDMLAFMRCSTDHHNVAVQAAPVPLLHHTSWEVDDIDEIGRGVRDVLEGHPERHVWGIGRHSVGGNFFYYLRDPSGNLTEYFADMDVITDDQLWDPRVFDGEPGMWGPPAPPSMIKPDDLTELMAGLHP